jgi:hypothetical protein
LTIKKKIPTLKKAQYQITITSKDKLKNLKKTPIRMGKKNSNETSKLKSMGV